MPHAEDERSDPPTADHVARLSEDDQAACDRLLEEGISVDREPKDEREAAVLNLLKLIDQYPDEEGETDLVARTLAKVDREEAKRRHDWTVSPEVAEKARLIRIPDSFAIAAAVLLVVSIGVPLYNQIDARQEIASSQMRQQAIGQAIAGFSADHDEALPIDLNLLNAEGDTLGDADATSYAVPDPVSHSWSSHLGILISQERMPRSMLFSIPVNAEDAAERSLVAYRVPFRIEKHRFEGTYQPGSFLLGDCNPVVESIRRSGRPCDSGVGADNHGRTKLVVLNFRLETSILKSPWLDQGEDGISDNLWVADDYDQATARETMIPETHEDTVLAH